MSRPSPCTDGPWRSIQQLGPDHPLTLAARKTYTSLLRRVAQEAEVTSLQKNEAGYDDSSSSGEKR